MTFHEVLDDYLTEHGIRHFRAHEIAPVGKAAGSGENAPRLMPPPAELWGWILPTLHVAEWLRRDLGGRPVIVTSGWRDAKYNRAVGGAKESMHVWFNALDLKVQGFTGTQLRDKLNDYPLAAFCGIGTYANSSNIVHLDTRGLFGRPAPARWHT